MSSAHTIHNALRKALRHGARAALLATHSPELIDLLTPGSEDHLNDRARLAEGIIRDGIETLPHPDSDAALALFALSRTRTTTTLEARRRQAAECVGVHPDTFRKPHHEGVLILDITSAIHESISAQSAGAR